MITMTDEETWTAYPDAPGYEVSTSGRVRSWRFWPDGLPERTARVLDGRRAHGTVLYQIAGVEHTIDDLMRWTYDPEDSGVYGDWSGDGGSPQPDDWDRTLTEYEVREIVSAEGLKPAFAVAEEFRIQNYRVRAIWDGKGQ